MQPQNKVSLRLKKFLQYFAEEISQRLLCLIEGSARTYTTSALGQASNGTASFAQASRPRLFSRTLQTKACEAKTTATKHFTFHMACETLHAMHAKHSTLLASSYNLPNWPVIGHFVHCAALALFPYLAELSCVLRDAPTASLCGFIANALGLDVLQKLVPPLDARTHPQIPDSS